MTPERVVAEHRVARLRHVVHAQDHEHARNDGTDPMQAPRYRKPRGDGKQQHNARKGPVATWQHDQPSVETNQRASLNECSNSRTRHNAVLRKPLRRPPFRRQQAQLPK